MSSPRTRPSTPASSCSDPSSRILCSMGRGVVALVSVWWERAPAPCALCSKSQNTEAITMITAGIALDGAPDHGVSEALYLRDPDQNGVELYWDKPQALWPRTPDGQLAMVTRRLDLDSLLQEHA